MRYLLVFALLGVCLGMPLFAQTTQPDMADVLKRLDALERRVQQLEQENAALRARSATAEPVAPASGAPAAATEAQPQSAAQPAVQQTAVADHEHGGVLQQAVQEVYPNLKLRGFADVDFSATDIKGQPSGFNLGQFVLHASSPLSKKVSVFGELSFTAHPTGYTAEVERVMVRFDANDYFKLSFGKYHTPINYWNTAYHHGSWLQTTISRPEMIQFGGRFLPVHFTGLLAEGEIPSGGLGLGYNFGVGNGRQTLSLLGRDGDAGDVNGNRAVVGELYARPSWLYGLQVGGSFYHDEITPDAGTATAAKGSYGEWIEAGHIVWTKENPEFITEFANVHHTSTLTGHEWNSQGLYTQIAYRLPGAAHEWKPYYRFEYIHVPATEPVLLVPDLRGHTAGVRYDITDYAAFKIEYRRAWRSPVLTNNGLYLQTAFTF